MKEVRTSIHKGTLGSASSRGPLMLMECMNEYKCERSGKKKKKKTKGRKPASLEDAIKQACGDRHDWEFTPLYRSKTVFIFVVSQSSLRQMSTKTAFELFMGTLTKLYTNMR
ncbi:unnamed protein product [Ilex paraguariensis]|uniref:Uncharacterized protein n=1 Tax=Ilex paraguariensis TaxID=185542 RepID=A0ABC8S962_9AQUA